MSETETAEHPSAIAQQSRGERHGLAIVVAQRGHVWVGEAETGPTFTHIKGARTVRRWGTTKGLNELAAAGPQKNTVLDAPADLKVNNQAVIAVIPCEAAQWNGH